MDPDALIAAATPLVQPDGPVTAAGVFGLQDNYLAIATGGVAADAALPGGAVGGALAGAAGTEAGRRANAAAKGVTVRMLVALTPTTIHVLALPALGSVPQRELLRFARASTRAEVSRFGLSRRVHLADAESGHELGLTGSTAPWSSTSKGAKAVLAELR